MLIIFLNTKEGKCECVKFIKNLCIFSKLQLHRTCSAGCKCGLQEFIPVCLKDGPIRLTFFSPCHAGCPTPPQGSTNSHELRTGIDIVPLSPTLEGPTSIDALNPIAVDLASYNFRSESSVERFYNCT